MKLENILHNQYISILRMTPDEYSNQGHNLTIRYSFWDSSFGQLLIASTPKGICSITIAPDEKTALENLKKKYPKAAYTHSAEDVHQKALFLIHMDGKKLAPITLHLKGSDFQLKVWDTLLTIPMGSLASYGEVSIRAGHPKACRAVGTAVGDNPVFFLIPCHRVILSSGKIGNYFWGTPLKTDIIRWESIHTIQE